MISNAMKLVHEGKAYAFDTPDELENTESQIHLQWYDASNRMKLRNSLNF